MNRIVVRIGRAFALLVVFIRDLVVANAVVAWEVLTPRHYMRPGIIGVPLRVRSEMEITLLANLISLTPGTLSLELSEDRTILYVHGLHVRSPEHLRATVWRLETRVMEVFR